jgi:hypothetical protein
MHPVTRQCVTRGVALFIAVIELDAGCSEVSQLSETHRANAMCIIPDSAPTRRTELNEKKNQHQQKQKEE